MSSKLPSPDIVRKQTLIHKFQNTELHDTYRNQYNPLFKKTYEEKVSAVLHRKLQSQLRTQQQQMNQTQKPSENNKMTGLKTLVGNTQQDIKNTLHKIETNGACSLQVKHVKQYQQAPIYGHNKFMSQMVYQNEQSLKTDQNKGTQQKEVSKNKIKAFDYESVVKRKQDELLAAREIKQRSMKKTEKQKQEEQEKIEKHKQDLILKQKRKDIKDFAEKDMSSLKKTTTMKARAIYTPSQNSQSISSSESEQDSTNGRFKDPKKVYRNHQRSLKRIQRDNRYTDQIYVRRKKELARVFNEDPNYTLTQIEFTVYVQDQELLFHIANKLQSINPKLFRVNEQELMSFIKKCDLFQLRNLIDSKISYDQFKQRTHRRTDEAYYITVDDLKDQGVQSSFFDDSVDHFSLVSMVGKDKFVEFMKCFYEVQRLSSVSPSDMLKERENWQSNQRCIKSIYQMIPQEIKDQWTRDFNQGKNFQKFLKEKRAANEKIGESRSLKKIPDLILAAQQQVQSRHSSVVPGDRNKDFHFMTEVSQNLQSVQQMRGKGQGSRLEHLVSHQDSNGKRLGLKEQLVRNNKTAGASSVVSNLSHQGGENSRTTTPKLVLDRSKFNNSGMHIKEYNFDQKQSQQHIDSRNKSVPPKRTSNNSKLHKGIDHDMEMKNFSFLRQLKNDGKKIQVHPDCEEYMYSKKEMEKKINMQHQQMFKNKLRPRDILGEKFLSDIQVKNQKYQLEQFFLQCFIQQMQYENQLKINQTEQKNTSTEKQLKQQPNQPSYQGILSQQKSQHTSTSNFSFQHKLTGRQDPQLSLVQSTNGNSNTSQDILSVERMAEQFQMKMNKSLYNPAIKGLPSFRATTCGDEKLNISNISGGRDTINTSRIPFKQQKKIFNESFMISNDAHMMTQASNYKRLVSTAGQPTNAITHMTKLSSRQNSKTMEGKDIISITDDGQNSIQNSQHTGHGSMANMSKRQDSGQNQQFSKMNIKQEIEDLLSPKTIMQSILKSSGMHGVSMKPYTVQKQRRLQQQHEQQLQAMRNTIVQAKTQQGYTSMLNSGAIKMTDGNSAQQQAHNQDVSEDGGDLCHQVTDFKNNNLKIQLSINKSSSKNHQEQALRRKRMSRGSNQDVTQVRVNNLAMYNNLSSITQELLNNQSDSQDVSKIHNMQIRKAYQSNLHSSTVEQSIGNSTQFRKSLKLEDQISSPNHFTSYEIGGVVNLKNTQKYNGVLAIANQIESGMSELKSNRESSLLSPLSPLKIQRLDENQKIVYLENASKTKQNSQRQTTPLTLPRQRIYNNGGTVPRNQLSNINSKENTLSDDVEGNENYHQQCVTMDHAKNEFELKMGATDEDGRNLQEMMDLDKQISESQHLDQNDDLKNESLIEVISKKDTTGSVKSMKKQKHETGVMSSNQDLLPVSGDESMHKILNVGSYDESNIFLQTNNSLRSDKKFNGPPILNKMVIKKQPEKATQPVKIRNKTYNVNSFKQQINQMNITKPALVKNYQKDSQPNSEKKVVANSRKTSQMNEHQPLVIINSGKNILNQETTDRGADHTVQNTYRENENSEDQLQDLSLSQS